MNFFEDDLKILRLEDNIKFLKSVLRLYLLILEMLENIKFWKTTLTVKLFLRSLRSAWLLML